MKKIICSVIQNPPSDWGVWRKVVDREKYLKFEGEFPVNAYFCDSVLNAEPNFEKIEILGRIGSPSADAEVYRIKFMGIEFAMKLMPRIDSDSSARNQNEISTAIEASQYPEHFPITFAYGYCSDSKYYKSSQRDDNERSPFIPKAIEYSIINKILNSISSKHLKKRFDSDYRNGMSITELKSKYKSEEHYIEDGTIQVDFLISELANGDLGNWMTEERSISEWKKVLIDVMTGIYYLTTQLKVVHPDLHPGNVLILKDNELKALIHDFGRCYPIEEGVEEMNKATLLSFTSEFINCSNRDDLMVPREILAIVQDINRSVEKERITMDNIQSIYENLIFPIISY